MPCRPVTEGPGPGHFQGAGQPSIPSSSHTLSSRLKEDAEIPRTENQVWILDTPSPSPFSPLPSPSLWLQPRLSPFEIALATEDAGDFSIWS